MSNVFESACGNVTTLAGDEIPNEIDVTDAAKAKIVELCVDEDEGSFLRVAVMGGGCSGFQYFFGFDNEIEEDDIIHEWDEGKVVVDAASMDFIKGSTIDYVKSFMGEHFHVRNVLATSQCGCGSSFSM